MVVKGRSGGASGGGAAFARTARMPLKKIKGLVKTGKSKVPKTVSGESKIAHDKDKKVQASVVSEPTSSERKTYVIKNHVIDTPAEQNEMRDEIERAKEESEATARQDLEQRDEIEMIEEGSEASAEPSSTGVSVTEPKIILGSENPAFSAVVAEEEEETLEEEAAVPSIVSEKNGTKQCDEPSPTGSSTVVTAPTFTPSNQLPWNIGAVTGKKAWPAALLQKIELIEAEFRDAATTIQKNYRMTKVLKTYIATVSSIVLLQSVARQRAARKEFNLARNAAIVLQKNARAVSCQKHYKATVSATVKVQALARKRSAQEAFATSKNAASIIQKNTRMVSCKSSYKATLSSIITVQSLARKKAAKPIIMNAKLEAMARKRTAEKATIIQKNVRMVQNRGRYAATLSSIVAIQAEARKKAAKKNLQDAKDAATRLQALARQRAAQEELRIARNAATVLQKNVRMVQCRANYTATLSSIVVIQALLRKNAEEKNYLIAKSSATKLQALARKHAAEMELLKAKNAASILLKNARMLQTRNSYKATLSSIAIVQALARKQAAKKKLQEAKEAATKLQALARKHAAEKEYLIATNAATTIQKNFRMASCKESYRDMLFYALASTFSQKTMEHSSTNTIWRDEETSNDLSGYINAMDEFYSVLNATNQTIHESKDDSIDKLNSLFNETNHNIDEAEDTFYALLNGVSSSKNVRSGGSKNAFSKSESVEELKEATEDDFPSAMDDIKAAEDTFYALLNQINGNR